MENQKYKTIYQTVEIDFTSGYQGNLSKKVQLDDEYDFCDGVQLVERSNANNDQYDISLEANSKTQLEPVPRQLLSSGDSVSPNGRFWEIAFAIQSGKLVNVIYSNDVATTAVVKAALVFRLRKAIDSEKDL